ncbi:MAG: DUF4382 domain-containing protein [Bacillota bacterium]
MSTLRVKPLLMMFCAIAALVFEGCNGMGSSDPTGVFNLSISDTPVDGATSVLITFTGVEIQPGSGGDQQDQVEGGNSMGNGDDQGNDDDNTPAPGSSTQSGASGTGMGDDDQGNDGNSNSGNNAKPLEFNFSSPMQIDLLKQQGGNSASLLNGVSLPAGHYAWIRLKLATTDCCTITLSDGSVHPLTIPSGDESGLKLVQGFTVAAGGTVNFTIDFDLRKSIVLANGKYILKPVLRLTDNEQTGQITGIVDNTFTIGSTAITDPTCMPAAYIYAGDNVTPVDINPASSVQPAATATVTLDEGTGFYVYRAGFLAPGDYTVALTCAAADNPTTADALTFSAAKNATVTANMSTEVDFP